VTDATGIRILRRGWMLKMTRAANGEVVTEIKTLSVFLGAAKRTTDNVTLKDCPAYIREWITGERQ
jgi:hypothetical protein